MVTWLKSSESSDLPSCGKATGTGRLWWGRIHWIRQLVQVNPARKQEKQTSRTLRCDLWSWRASFVDPHVAPHLHLLFNLKLSENKLEQTWFFTWLSSAVRCGGVSPFEFLLFKTHTYTQSAEVQRDGGSLHFMWVQCRQENKSACAPIVDSPDSCHSSQGEMSSGEIQKNNKAVNF